MHIVVDEAAVEAHTRLVAFETANAFLALHRQFTDATGLKPVSMLVWVTVAVASAQRFMRTGPVPEAHRGRTPLPVQLSGAISRRGIALATGLPLETVRRHIDALINDGRLIEVGRGRLCTPPGAIDIAQPAVLAAVMVTIARLSNQLAHVGALDSQKPGLNT